MKPKERPSKRQRTVCPDPEEGGGHEAAGAGEGSEHDDLKMDPITKI